MIECISWLAVLASCGCFAFAIWAPPRSVIWRAVKHWGEDNELAALVREGRRAARKLFAGVEVPRA